MAIVQKSVIERGCRLYVTVFDRVFAYEQTFEYIPPKRRKRNVEHCLLGKVFQEAQIYFLLPEICASTAYK